MCFSAGASFAGAAILTATGIATIRVSEKPSQKLFASIPLLFAMQQASEGVIWLTLKSGEHGHLQFVALIIYLVMALIAWPLIIPVSVRMMEPDIKKKKLLIAFLVAGSVVALFYVYCMFTFDTTPRIENHHIKYGGELPKSIMLTAFFIYLTATIVPLFISNVRRMKVMAILIFLSLVVSGIFYKEYLTSVWCFFAALISVVIFWILKEENRKAVE